MENNNIEKEIDVLFAEKEVVIDGGSIIVRPYSWANAIRIIRPMGVLADILYKNVDALSDVLKTDEPNPEAANLMDRIGKFVAIMDGVDLDAAIGAITELLRLATGKPREYIEHLAVDDMIKLGMAVYEVNKHFFTKRLGIKPSTATKR